MKSLKGTPQSFQLVFTIIVILIFFYLITEQVLNHTNEQELRQEYQTYQQTQIEEIAVQQQPPK